MRILNERNKPIFVHQLYSQVLDVTEGTRYLKIGESATGEFLMSKVAQIIDIVELRVEWHNTQKIQLMYRPMRSKHWEKGMPSGNLEHCSWTVESPQDIDRLANHLEDAIVTALYAACPERIVKSTDSIWWNRRLERLQRVGR